MADAGTSRGANLLADLGVDQRDPAERRGLIDSWLQQISLDSGLLGMEKVLEHLHSTSSEPPSSPRAESGTTGPLLHPMFSPSIRTSSLRRPNAATRRCSTKRSTTPPHTPTSASTKTCTFYDDYDQFCGPRANHEPADMGESFDFDNASEMHARLPRLAQLFLDPGDD
ncbi:hypothetical protein OHB41_48135 [Streptomyces sp. NBC_01571]|nr:hypothetical protein [Streptomyces sp. NBC_01571]MCX4580757.1 hypothetical protein [Streptomyces sp. NBC_01571]